MDNRTSRHYMTISEFAAATQLSPKALRLYDQQGFLRPSIVDSANGYRYYTREQIAVGRIVRTLRDMDLSLNQISQVVAAGTAAERLLLEHSREIDRRYAREKRAFRSALLLLRDHEPRDLPTIQQIDRELTVLLVHPFRSLPDALSSRFFAERQQAMLHAEESELCADGPAMCAFTEHGTDEELALEILLPIRETGAASRSVALRRMPPRRYAAVPTTGRELDAAEIAALSDALFDWFDRAGHRSIDSPLLSLPDGESGGVLLMWAFEPV